jgi:hypothetical protein
MTLARVLRLSMLLVFAACSINHRSADFLCEKQSDCSSDRTCSQGVCVLNGNPMDDGPIVPPDAPEFRCPAQCTSCVEGTKTCRVDCGLPSGAAICNQAITCPTGFNCVILCSRNAVNGNPQCQQKIDCENSKSCEITCSGSNTCKQIVCGEAPCDVTCSGFGSCGSVDCDASCQCDVDCGFNASCQNVSCPGDFGQCNALGQLGCDSDRADACHSCP